MRDFMNIQLKALAASIIFVSFMQADFIQLPDVIVANISNYTDEDLIFKDRFTGDIATIPAAQTARVNFFLNSRKNILINGSLKDALSKEAQYIVQKVDSYGYIIQESYLHMNALEGGINDGSGFIIGTPGTVIFKFLLAGKNGGSQMSTKKIKSTTLLLEVNVEFSTPRSVIEAEYELVEK